MVGRMDGRMEGRMDGRIDGQMEGRTDGWMDGWTDGRAYVTPTPIKCHFQFWPFWHQDRDSELCT